MKNFSFFGFIILISYIEFCVSANYDDDPKSTAVVEDKQLGYVPHGPLVKCSFLPWEFVDCDEPIDHKGNKTAKEESGKGCVKFGGSRYEDVERATVTCEVLPDIECFGPRVFKRDGFPCVKMVDGILAALSATGFFSDVTGLMISCNKINFAKNLFHLFIQHGLFIGLSASLKMPVAVMTGGTSGLYKGHYFATTLIYSILLGFLGMDRFSLAQTGTAVGKLLTLGGVGVWWLVDVVLLVTGSLQPEDSSNWNPYV